MVSQKVNFMIFIRKEDEFKVSLNLDRSNILHIPIEMTTNEDGLSVLDLMIGKTPTIKTSDFDN